MCVTIVAIFGDWKNLTIFFQRSVGHLPIFRPNSVPNCEFRFPSKMLNFTISSIFHPKRFCSAPSHVIICWLQAVLHNATQLITRVQQNAHSTPTPHHTLQCPPLFWHITLKNPNCVDYIWLHPQPIPSIFLWCLQAGRFNCVHLQVTHSQFHATTFHLVLLLFVSQLPKYGIPYHLTFCSLKHSLHLDII